MLSTQHTSSTCFSRRSGMPGIVFLLLLLTCLPALAERHITDMLGRKVTVPDTISKIYASSPPATLMAYAMNPDLLVGLNMAISPQAVPFVTPNTAKLPIIGGWFGNGNTANVESIMALHPDIILVWIWQSGGMDDKIVRALEAMHIPVVCLVLDSLRDYPKALEFLGSLLHMKERGHTLAHYGQQAIDDITQIGKEIPAPERPAVYYAENTDGLNTDCNKSMHAELLNLCNANNVHRCSQRTRMGMDKISIEQVLNYDPEIIISLDPIFTGQVSQDAKWKSVKAVQNGKIYTIPSLPFNWFDRPPSFMRFLGLKWLMHTLYPGRYSINMVNETKEFFHLFLHVDINSVQAQKLLNLPSNRN